MPNARPERAAKGLDRLLPALVWDAPELRNRARALIRVALWVFAWTAVTAGILYRAGRVELSGVVALSALGSLAALPRMLRSADPPASASWLGLNVLLASFFGALASGGPASPLMYGAAVTAAASAAFGSSQGVATALLVPVGLYLARNHGLVMSPLTGILGDGAGLATLALVAGASAEFLVAERKSRAEVKARAIRQGMLSTDSLRHELDRLRSLLVVAPVGLFTVERDGRVGAARSRALDAVLPDATEGTELLALFARVGDADAMAGARAALAAWIRSESADQVLPALPARLRHPTGWWDLRYAPVVDEEGRLERIVVGVMVSGEPPSLPKGALPMADVLQRSAARGHRLGVEVSVSAEPIPVPNEVADGLEAAVDALVENAVVHGLGRQSDRVAAGKPASGQVELRVTRRGRRIVLSVADDGRGFDWRRVTEVAHARGWPAMGRRELEAVLTRPDFSLSNRPGQGLARVRAAVESLGGKLSFESSVVGEGAVVELSLPDPIPSRLSVRARATPPPPPPPERPGAA